MEMENWPAADFIEFIDRQYVEAKAWKLSRLDVGWGKWSREMNLVLRDRINSKEDPEELRLKHVIVYWTLKSQILEFYHKKGFLHAGKIKKRKKEAAQARDAVLTGAGLQEFEMDANLAEKIMG